ncbi:MAG: phospho-N-acetylmuramoyl-pentapeptide-transferase [Candidatus Omnitrophica bacterium 4484_70.2]|nr:MAG: phospho-N-acetylmuramoyl-pentapeptide-transferase [Candidatus Omnitrophica bacterium 4484_70.2]
MIYHLLYPLSKYLFIFNITRYITFRSIFSFTTSFFLVFIFWKFFLHKLRKLKIREKVDMYGHSHLEILHRNKEGTPTMGGILIICAVIFSTLLWARWNNVFIWYTLGVMLGLGGVGLLDDILKIKKGKGLSRVKKLCLQILVGMVLGILIVVDKNLSTRIGLPFFKKVIFDVGYFYIFWSILVIAASSNAVNFTDGLDGLAIGGIITNCLVFAVLSYITGNIKFANYLFLPYIEKVGELTVYCSAIVGASLGFLWFNAYPAEIFMGDVGALSLGGTIGAVALLTKKEFLLILSGGLFFIEALSVILQILSVKVRGKRLFKAAPLHHHFQLLGWQEPKIIVRFWIISILFAAFALLTLKIR